jgi:TolB-like protein
VGEARKLEIRLLGELAILADGISLALPPSRKTRGLLAYLALADRRQRREDLCELLWDAPGDPRAALRWSLAKLRPLLSHGTTSALLADRETVALDFDILAVDVLEARSRLSPAAAPADEQELARLEQRFSAGYLNGLDDLGSRQFQLWLETQRTSLRDLHRSIIVELMSKPRLPEAALLQLAGKLVALDPLSDASNIRYLKLVFETGGLTEARQAFERIARHYRDERQADSVLVAGWHSIARAQTGSNRALLVEQDDVSPQTVETALPEKPSVAVLDFRDIGSHPDGAVLANGLTVDLNSRLAQLPSLFVIARQSTARISALNLAPQQIGVKLGARYLISGATQRDNKRVRTTITLTDTSAQSELWSEHFDRPLDDLFRVQDDITNAVIAAIEPAIEHAEMQRALLKPPDSLTAWECFHRGLWHCFRFTAQDNEIAHRLFLEAVTVDPRFSRAFAGLSFTHYSRAFLNTVADVDREISEALDAASRSVDFDGRDAMGHWALGRALFLSRQHDRAMSAIDRALLVNPNYAQGHYARGFVGIHAGLDDASLPSLEMAQRLSPFDPLLFAMKSSRAISLANRGRSEEAASWAIAATQEPNAHFHIYAVAAACLELAGRSADARNNAGWVLERQPAYTVDVFRRSFPHKDESARENFLAALGRAGLPWH